MTFVLRVPEASHSPLRRLDARWKLVALASAGISLAFVRHLPPALVGLVLALGVGLWANVSLRWLAERLALAMVFIAMFGVWLPFLPADGHVVTHWLGWRISLTGLSLFAALLCKTSAAVLVFLLLLVTTPVIELFRAARELRLPRVLVQVILMTWRYLDVLGEEFQRLRLALRVRAFRSRANLHTYRTVGQVTGTLMVRGHERAERVAQAMRCRGFDGEMHTMREFRSSSADWWFATLVFLGFGAVLLWDVTAW